MGGDVRSETRGEVSYGGRPGQDYNSEVRSESEQDTPNSYLYDPDTIWHHHMHLMRREVTKNIRVLTFEIAVRSVTVHIVKSCGD